ncbi:hypothetical protein CEV31_3434 [Brucella thiophenivorans]|uniref:Uncharacterized protein n=1 Tax=Brucella thiophenivorans TaxID=571255 RepID=A0A256FF31_9HYPH|nr:hypothetical protein CEV31_3434 [Brucella thiophenivorans]
MVTTIPRKLAIANAMVEERRRAPLLLGVVVAFNGLTVLQISLC